MISNNNNKSFKGRTYCSSSVITKGIYQEVKVATTLQYIVQQVVIKDKYDRPTAVPLTKNKKSTGVCSYP